MFREGEKISIQTGEVRSTCGFPYGAFIKHGGLALVTEQWKRNQTRLSGIYSRTGKRHFKQIITQVTT